MVTSHKESVTHSAHPLTSYGAGMIGGITRTLVSYPFDTVKVLLQSQKPVDLSPQRLYQGVAVPLTSNVLISGLMLGMQRNLYRFTHNHALSGFCTGIAMSVVMSPVDYLKIQKQVSCKINKPGLKIFTGIKACAVKEAVSGAVFFGEYERMQRLNRRPAICGAWAGICAVLVTHPFDVIKTRMQCGIPFRDAVAMREFNSGLAVCCVKAAVMNAAAYAAINLFTGGKQTAACPKRVSGEVSLRDSCHCVGSYPDRAPFFRKPQRCQHSMHQFSSRSVPLKKAPHTAGLYQPAALSPGRDMLVPESNRNLSKPSGLLCSRVDHTANLSLSPAEKS